MPQFVSQYGLQMCIGKAHRDRRKDNIGFVVERRTGNRRAVDRL
jgi:hypothetical protein